MSLLREIQQSLFRENCDISSVFLKLKFLASRFENNMLDDWVKHETQGYPDAVELPDYRKIKILYTANFVGDHKYLEEIAIDPYEIDKLIPVADTPKGWNWNRWSLLDSIITIDNNLKENSGKSYLRLPRLERAFDNKYDDMKCISVSGTIANGEFARIRYIVLENIMDLTIKLEKEFPKIIDITMDMCDYLNPVEIENINKVLNVNIFNVHGDNSRINSDSEDNSQNIANKNKPYEDTFGF